MNKDLVELFAAYQQTPENEKIRRQFFESFFKEALPIAYKLTGDHYWAESIVQQVAEKIWKNTAEIQHIYAWMHRVIRNTFYNERRVTPISAPSENSADLFLPDVSQSPLQLLEYAELSVSLLETIARMKNPLYRKVLMCLYDSMSNREIAEVLGRETDSPRTIATLVYRARAALRKELEKNHS
ncbi:MAG: RNA polymerase sigma factor [Bacteroidota bacterium]